MDFNDNRPQFSQPLYEVEVSENIPPGTEILQIEASDRDEDKRLVYAIQSSAHSSSMLSFRIDPKSGLLEVADRLDREAVHTHILTVLVRDHGLSSKRNFVRVVIRVLDHNDHAPTFLSAKFEGKVYETSAIGTSVVQVLAVDRDKGKNAEIQYSILSGKEILTLFNFGSFDLRWHFVLKPLL